MNLGNHQPISLEVEVENSLGCVWPEIVDAADFLANPPPDPEPLIESVLNKGEKMLVGGPAKIGKTWLALDLATAVASATPWLGFQTRRGRVLFIGG
jgi:RecA-family ATPase